MISVQPQNKQLYYEQVWTLARQIPYARVATYGQIAKMLDKPADVSPDDYKMYAARWVGLAMACLLYTSPSPRDKRQSRMPSSA